MRLFDFSILGCPNNLYPNHPWRRRAIRGSIATVVVISSPLIVVGALVAAVVFMPVFLVCRFLKKRR